MGRKPRVEYYGAIYHVVQKGNNIFKDYNDKRYFLELLSESREIYDFRLFAYAIMDDNYHILLQTLNIPISKVIHSINSRYAKYYNSKMNRTGPVFKDRYRGVLIHNEINILPLVKYIHNRPVAAKICNAMDKYRWSSDAFYRVNMEGMVDIEYVLNMLSENRLESVEKYMKFMEDNLAIKIEETTKSKSEEDARENMDLDKILKMSCPTEEEYKLIKECCRRRYLTKYKAKYIQSGRVKGYTYNELGKNIGITAVAARALVKVSQKK